MSNWDDYGDNEYGDENDYEDEYDSENDDGDDYGEEREEDEYDNDKYSEPTQEYQSTFSDVQSSTIMVEPIFESVRAHLMQRGESNTITSAAFAKIKKVPKNKIGSMNEIALAYAAIYLVHYSELKEEKFKKYNTDYAEKADVLRYIRYLSQLK